MRALVGLRGGDNDDEGPTAGRADGQGGMDSDSDESNVYVELEVVRRDQSAGNRASVGAEGRERRAGNSGRSGL